MKNTAKTVAAILGISLAVAAPATIEMLQTDWPEGNRHTRRAHAAQSRHAVSAALRAARAADYRAARADL